MRAASMWPGFRRVPRLQSWGRPIQTFMPRSASLGSRLRRCARFAVRIRCDAWCRDAGTAPRSEKRAVMPTIVFHGDQDKTVHPRNGAEVIARASVEGHWKSVSAKDDAQGRKYTRSVLRDRSGQIVTEKWEIHGGGHAWSGGSRAGSYTDPAGPDATAHMLKFFLDHKMPSAEGTGSKSWCVPLRIENCGHRIALGDELLADAGRAGPTMTELTDPAGTATARASVALPYGQVASLVGSIPGVHRLSVPPHRTWRTREDEVVSASGRRNGGNSGR